MSALRLFLQMKKQLAVAVFSAGLSFCVAHSAISAPAQSPLFLAQPVTPVMMLNMSNDHQLFFKIYDDYADITSPSGGAPDGIPDTTYINDYDYYGYFDEAKCYTYNTSTNRFEPSRARDTDRYCNYSNVTTEWSGNFLNWASMTRMDAVRKILYGGLRSTDTATTTGDTPTTGETVLERAFLPHDAHSFAKFYDGADIEQLTPFTVAELQADTNETGITICNTTPGGTSLSQSVTSAPLLRIAQGNYTFWASNERYQCRWRSDISDTGQGFNGNDVTSSGVYAYNDSPADAHKLGSGSAAGEFYARVQVCVPGLLETNCSNYPTGDKKPTGLLQKYGETQRISFGLMTGSYGKSKSGGVLRKPVGTMANEINVSTSGTFTGAAGVIQTLNKLRIYGYRYQDGTYHNDTHAVDANGSDGCKWGFSTFSDGQCTNWGNPQAEIFLESLRYLAGKTVNSGFYVDDTSKITGLATAAWGAAPVTSSNYCAPLNVIQFNASTTSYDGDDLATFSDLTSDTLDTWTNSIANSAHENLSGSYFVGKNGADNNELCTAKTISSFSQLRGTCPDAPRLEGSYHIAGLAYFARQRDIMPSLTGDQKVLTYGVALAPAVPKAVVPIPGSTRSITILPACRNTYQNPNANCAIVDFKIVSQTSSESMNSGRLYVNWEDSEQGGDYDQDMWGIIDYQVTSADVTITTDVIAESTSQSLGFGYVVNGTTADGFYVHSGVEGFTLGDCDNCQVANSATAKTFSVGTSDAKLLESPLYYAAKWGGYSEELVATAKKDAGSAYDNNFLVSRIKTRDVSDSYYIATDPRRLEESLEAVFARVESTIGGAATVAANSTRLDENTLVYQARFDSSDWSGEMVAYPVTEEGEIDTENPTWSTHELMPTDDDGRKIFTYDGATTKSTLEVTEANWNTDSLPTLKAALKNDGVTDEVALQRMKWLRGNRSDETNVGGLRERNHLLGDIINSDPAFSGANDMRYNYLPAVYGSASYATYVSVTKRARTPLVFVGANDGMLHAFNANTGAEIFSYIPTGVFANLANLTKPAYQHQYYVDGPMFVGDVYFDNDSDGVGGTWKTILVGSLGAGGRGIFALDVSDPLAPQVLFDFNAGDGSALSADLGYITGQPLIVPTKANNTGNGVWAVIFGNGTESTNGVSKLIAIDIEDITKTVAINTQSGTGLSAPALLPDSQGVITDAYAGDLTGKMWRFDLTNTTLTSWASKFRASGNPAPFFTTRNALGLTQPISAAPTLGYNTVKTKSPSGAPSVMVYFGTGKYSISADNSTTGIQSFYGIADTDARVTITGLTRDTVLHKKTISAETSTERTIINDATPSTGTATVNWTSKSGWYIDLVTPGSLGTGERVVSKPRLLFDRLLFTTFLPSAEACKFGGSGWLMELTGVGDKYIEHSILGDMANTSLEYGILGSGGLTPIMSGERVLLPLSNIKGEIDDATGTLPAAVRGRMSWRQLR